MIVASIDIGTNTILLLIAEVNKVSKQINVLENIQRIPRIGKGLKENEPMPEDNIKRMFDVLSDYSLIIKKYNCDKVLLTGTNALRISSNKNEIIKRVKDNFGYDLNIISGEEEAFYSYSGAIAETDSQTNNLIIDIGGGSTEIIFGRGNEIKYKKSFNVGVVSGTEKFLLSDPPEQTQIKNFINHALTAFSELVNNIKDINKAIAIAGTPTTLAAIKNNLKEYNEDLIEGSFLTKEDLNNFVNELSALSSNEILNKYQIVKGREDVLLAGTIILKVIMEILKLDIVAVSTKGIRYGAIINWLNTSNNLN